MQEAGIHVRFSAMGLVCFLVLLGGFSFIQILWAFWPSSKQPFLSEMESMRQFETELVRKFETESVRQFKTESVRQF
jgi:hypothetical protein